MINKLDSNVSQRQLRAANLIKMALIEVLRNGKALDKRLIDINITISDVRLSPDLRHATCYVLPFVASKISASELMEAFESCKNSIRAMVTKKINLKYSPELRFLYDQSYEKAFKIEKLIKQNKENISEED